MFAALLVLSQATTPGATLRVYDIGMPLSELPILVAGQTPNIDRRLDRIELKDGQFGVKDHFYAEVTAEFHAAQSGIYSFKSTSDDGSEIVIAGKSVAENDGVHPPSTAEGKVNLTAGWHALKLRFFEHEGGEELKLEWKGPGQASYSVVDSSVTRVPAGLTRVTSPGTKAVMGIGGKRRPGNGMPLAGMHPGWDLVNIRPAEFRPQVGSMTFLPNGKLLVGNFKPNQSGGFQPNLKDGVIYLVDGVTGNDRSKVKVSVFARGLKEPLGLCTILDKEAPGGCHIYLAQNTEITELIDKDQDGVCDETKTVAKAWIVDNYHHFHFGLAERDGYLYSSLATSITGEAVGINGPNPANRGTVLKIDPKAYNPSMPMANVEFLTGGHRTPNGIEFGPHGLLLVGENQGAWQPANKINVVTPGGFYGHYNNTVFKNREYPNGGVPGPFDEQPLEQPALYLPQNEIANSPAQSVVIPDGEFKDHLLISDVKYGGLRRAWLEEVDGQWQGGVVQHSQGFECGTNRLEWGPDGALYVGGIGATETWAWTDPKTGKWTTFGLQKMKRNGKRTFEIAKVTATRDGFHVLFTEPLGKGWDAKDSYAVRQWNYEPGLDYGGDKKNRETLAVTEIHPDKGMKGVRVTIPGLKAGRVVYLNLGGVKSSSGKDLWATECWYTLNRRPAYDIPQQSSLVVPKPRVLVFSKTAGFRHDSIPTGVATLREMAGAKGFTVEATEDPAVFTTSKLEAFDVIVFLNTTGDILDEAQQKAMEAFVEGGGGFVGIHSASDTEYDWPWYGKLVGGYFKRHPAIQQARIVVEDRAHPATTFLPNNWQRVDEWYDFRINPRNDVRVLLSLDPKSYQNSEMSDDHPITWCHEVGKGRAFYTGFGHTPATYKERLFQEMLYQGIVWAAQAKWPGNASPIEFKETRGWSHSNGEWANPAGHLPNLVSQKEFGDGHYHFEFRIPKGSNSGVYLQGRYEIQIHDDFGLPWKQLTYGSIGGIYHGLAEDQDGFPAMRNAVRAPGEWNSYDILFRAPRFQGGKKVQNALVAEVRLNGVLIHRNVELGGVTLGPMFENEAPVGPIMLQGDHGAVTYRNMWHRPVILDWVN